MNKHIGSDFDDFLHDEDMQEEVTAAAMKRVIAWQLAQAMKERKITQKEMASRMRTSRMVVARLLNESDTSVTLATLARASVAIGVPLKIEIPNTEPVKAKQRVPAKPATAKVVAPKRAKAVKRPATRSTAHRTPGTTVPRTAG